MMNRLALPSLLLGLTSVALGPTVATAQGTASLPTSVAQFGVAGMPSAVTDTATSPTAASTATPVSPVTETSKTCREHLPPGKERPQFEEQFPSQTPAGHAAILKVTLTHGKGERVLADAFDLQRDSDGAKVLRQSGFEFPSLTGPGAPRVTRTERESDAVTVVELSVVPLPKESGPHPLTLPPLPIAVARASGEVMTLCTSPHPVNVTDPTANVPNATPRLHPGGERQRELWVTARNVTYGALLGLAVAALVYLVLRWFNRRPKALPPPPPPRPAWETALAALSDIRHSNLISQGQFTSHLERVTHVLRRYLGDTYGFDGLESTTEEVLGALKASRLTKALYTQTEQMLRESDLVKFAKLVPTEAQCNVALDDVEGLVRQTMHDAQAAQDSNEQAVATSLSVEEANSSPTVVGAPIRASGAQSLVIPEAPGAQPVTSSAELRSTNKAKEETP